VLRVARARALSLAAPLAVAAILYPSGRRDVDSQQSNVT
jgi:hypothetical protein